MKLGEKHRIFLIKGNEELIKLEQDAKAQYEEYSAKVKEAMENPEGHLMMLNENSHHIPYGFKTPSPDKDAYRQDQHGYWVPNKKTKSGKRIHQALRVLGPFDLPIYTWMAAKKLSVAGLVLDGGQQYFLSTQLSSNKERTEFLLFIPDVTGSQAYSHAVKEAGELGEEISYGNFYDDYRETHVYQVL